MYFKIDGQIPAISESLYGESNQFLATLALLASIIDDLGATAEHLALLTCGAVTADFLFSISQFSKMFSEMLSLRCGWSP